VLPLGSSTSRSLLLVSAGGERHEFDAVCKFFAAFSSVAQNPFGSIEALLAPETSIMVLDLVTS